MEQRVFKGIGVSGGVRIAKAFVYRQPKVDCNRDITPENVSAEVNRLKIAVTTADEEVSELIKHVEKQIGEKQLGVLKGQKSLLADPAFVPEIEKLITGKCCSAEKAVSQVTEKFISLFDAMPNEYMKERASDVRDAGNRLIKHLSKRIGKSLSETNGKIILVADDLSASDTVQLDRNYVIGFATEKGGKTSHTSIFANSLGIPAVVGVRGLLLEIHEGDTMILDGSEGLCIKSPSKETLGIYQKKYEDEQKLSQLYKNFSYKESVLSDGSRIVAAANIGSASDIEFSISHGAEAVGLMRTETLFMSRSNAPAEEEQFLEYKKAAEAFSNLKPGGVIIRTLDIGGDKAAAYFNILPEANPFLGLRAIRLCFKRENIFITQLRAILRASAFGKIKVMFPMISGIEELRKAKKLFQQAKNELDNKGIAYDPQIQAGIMIEIPSAALMSDILASEADFFSIGTNDLTQYTLAADRGNKNVSEIYDYFDPAVLQLIRITIEAARHHNIPVGMCGSMAGNPAAAPLLAGMGINELSMAPGMIPQIKYVLSKCSLHECEKLAEKTRQCINAREIHETVDEFTKKLSLV